MDRKREKELIYRFREHDDQTAGNILFKELRARIGGSVKKIALGYSLDTNKWEDVLQDTITLVIENIENEKYDPEGPARLATYSFRVAYYKVRSESRKERRKPNSLDQLLETPANDKVKNPLTNVSEEEFIDLLSQAIAKLPKTDQKSFFMYTGLWKYKDKWIDGQKLTFKDIGRNFGKSKDWARRRYLKIVIKLIKMLKGEK